MGPNSDDREVMKQLLLNGMDVARFNFSHGTHDEQRARYKQLREVAEEVGKPVAALLDTKGPEIRTRLLKDGQKVKLESGNQRRSSLQQRISSVTQRESTSTTMA